MRATRAQGGTGGRSAASGWIDVRHLHPRAAAVDPAAARRRGAPLHAAAPLGGPAALDQDRRRAEPAFDNAAIEAGPAVESDAAVAAVTMLGAAGGHGANL